MLIVHIDWTAYIFISSSHYNVATIIFIHFCSDIDKMLGIEHWNICHDTCHLIYQIIRKWYVTSLISDCYEIYYANSGDGYTEIPHGLGVQPMYVIFQIKLGTTGDVADGIGNSFTYIFHKLIQYRMDMIKLWK